MRENKKTFYGKIANESEEIMLGGTIIAINPAQGLHPHQKWMVTLRVDSILAGCYSAETFFFSTHSPTKSGIAVGGKYVVNVTRTPKGYLLNSVQLWKE